MIDLANHEHTLRQVVAAGDTGLPIAEVGVSTAIRFALDDLVEITKTEPQRVIATAKGRTFSRRGVFA